MNRVTAPLSTPLGKVSVRLENGILAGVDLEPQVGFETNEELPAPVAAELQAYFADGARPLNLPVILEGTPFQKRVWAELRRIPPGETVTYGDLARRLGTSPRAVGGACRANPCPIVVPCHRVVGAQGLGGFAGDTTGRRLDVKRWLLRHEGAASVSGSCDAMRSL